MTLPTEDFTPEPTGGELVHWMEPHGAPFGIEGVSTTTVAAFALGVVATVGALAAFRYLAPRREGLPPWKWRRGAIH